jgi:hypothetical protein
MFAWEDGVAEDPRLQKMPYALHFVRWLRKKLRDDGKPYEAEQSKAASEIGVSVRTVSTVVRALKKFGHLNVISGKLRRRENGYLPGDQVRNRLRTSKDCAAQCGVDTQSAAYGVRAPLRRSTSFKTSSNSCGCSAEPKKSFEQKRQTTRWDQGAVEQAIASQLGPGGWDVLHAIGESEVQKLCEQHRAGSLSEVTLAEIKLFYETSHSAGSAPLKKSVG